MAADIRAWLYTDDLGNTYQRGLAEYVGAQTDGTHILVGGRAAVSGDEPLENLPAGVKPRTVALINAAGTKRRRLTIFDTTVSPLWLGTSSSINLQDGSGASAAYTVYSRSGERRRVRAPGV